MSRVHALAGSSGTRLRGVGDVGYDGRMTSSSSLVACFSIALALVPAFLPGCGSTPAAGDDAASPRDAAVGDTGGGDAGAPDATLGDAGADDAGSPDAATEDAGSPDAASVDAAAPVDAFAGVDGGGSPCGTARPSLTATSGTEGLVIARDGTIYYSVSGGVARITPAGSVDEAWLRIASGATIWGLGLDASQTRLFVAYASGDQLLVVTDLDATPSFVPLASVSRPNGVTVGPDGTVYVSEFTNGAVVAVDPATGATTTVTTTTVPGADGVAFTEDGRLLVTAYSAGTVVALQLDAAHHETGRATVATSVPSADGVAVDENGVIYVGGGSRVFRIGPGGTPDATLQMGRAGTANLEWGAGALDCHDLYVATGGGLTRISLTVGQRAVPWH